MRKRIIIYDLHHKDSYDYNNLYVVLKRLHCEQLNESAYLIKTDYTQEEIEKMISKTIKDDDTVYFVSVDVNNHLLCKRI